MRLLACRQLCCESDARRRMSGLINVDEYGFVSHELTFWFGRYGNLMEHVHQRMQAT